MDRPFANSRPFGPFVAQEDVTGTRKRYGRRIEPLVMIRDFDSDVNDGVQNRSYMARWGTLSYEILGYGTLRADFGFHEKFIDNDFTFPPMGVDEGGGRTLQGTPLEDLGGKPGKFGRMMREIYGGRGDYNQRIEFDFAEINAASQGQKYLTSYEFEYELLLNKSDITNVNIDEQL